MLTMRITVGQETYERIVSVAIDSPRSIPQQAGVVLRRAFGLPMRNILPDLNTAPAMPEPLSEERLAEIEADHQECERLGLSSCAVVELLAEVRRLRTHKVTHGVPFIHPDDLT